MPKVIGTSLNKHNLQLYVHSPETAYRFSSVQDDCKIIFPPRIEAFANHNFMTHRSRQTRLLRENSTVDHFRCNRSSLVSTVQHTAHYYQQIS